MADAHIDQNSRNILTGYNNTTGLIENFHVDPVTGALLVYGVASDGNTSSERLNAKMDGNSRNTLSAYNETSGQVESLQCSDNGELLIKIM